MHILSLFVLERGGDIGEIVLNNCEYDRIVPKYFMNFNVILLYKVGSYYDFKLLNVEREKGDGKE